MGQASNTDGAIIWMIKFIYLSANAVRMYLVRNGLYNRMYEDTP